MRAASVMRPRWRAFAVLAAVVVLAVPLTAAAADDDDDERGRELVASLTGDNEVPGPGDPNGRGDAEIELAGTKVCFEVEWTGIEAPTAAHIHAGASDVAGPVVVLLFATDGRSGLPTTISEVEGCTTADASLVQQIRDKPADYYVNVHNVDFPDGAVRGQLHRE